MELGFRKMLGIVMESYVGITDIQSNCIQIKDRKIGLDKCEDMKNYFQKVVSGYLEVLKFKFIIKCYKNGN